MNSLPLDCPIEKAGVRLNIRCYNELHKAGIKTVADLMNCDRNKLKEIPTLGTKYYYKLIEFLDFIELNSKSYLEVALPDETNKIKIPIESNNEDIIYLIPNDSIEKITAFISTRSYNGLRRANIKTIADLIEYDHEKLTQVRNLGATSIKEIIAFIDYLKLGTGKFRIVSSDELQKIKIAQNDIETVIVFYDDAGILRDDIPLENLNFSKRTYNWLKHSGYDFASQLVVVTEKQLFEIRNLGLSSVNEIMKKIKSLNFSEPQKDKSSVAENELCKSFASEISKQFPAIHGGKLYHELLPIYENAEKTGTIADKKELFANVYLRNAVKDKILSFVSDFNFGAYPTDIMLLFPEDIIEFNIIEEIIEEMKADGKIIVNKFGNRIECKKISILEYEPDEKIKKDWDKFLKRLQGLTLDEIGTQYNISKSRVGQIILNLMRFLRKTVVFSEDKYIDIFKKYAFFQKDFMLAFDESEAAHNYINIACEKSGEQPLEELVEDESYPIEVRKGAEKAIAARIAKNHVVIGGERIYKDRPNIADYVMRTYFQDEASFDTFIDYYSITLDDLGLSEDKKLIMNDGRTYENRIAESDKVLWKFGRKFRYYNIESRDYTDFYRELAFEQYTDIEYSTLKFFKYHAELMQQYDIRDEYELHNLLKKLYRNKENTNITFNRMPMIEFGKADRDSQVLDLLVQLAPVTLQDFGAAYESEYGVQSVTVMANFVKNFDVYFHDGVYNISTPPFPPEQFNRMSELLTGDYYEISDVKRIYQREFPDNDIKMINPHTLKTLGYRVFASYVVKNIYSSAADYFNKLLTAEDIVDTRSFPPGINGIVSYTSELYGLRNRYEIIEFEPYCYINIRRLNNIGVSVEDIRAYCDDAAKYIDLGVYFTITSLKNNGYEHALDDLGFNEVFYASLLTEDNRFYYQRMGNTKVFRKGVSDVSLKGFIEYIISQEISIDIYDLTNLLIEKYGVNIDRYKIISTVNNCSMYYDTITEKVYINYDTYFEEV